jgi:hypothetical protein
MQAVADTWVQNINNVIKNKAGMASVDATLLSPLSLSPTFIYRMSEQMARIGSTITIAGLGLNTENDIYFGSSYILRKVPGNNDVLTFMVPNLPLGRYDITVKNSKGISNSLFFVVVPQNIIPVTISTVAPTKIKYGQSVTLSGSGFTSTGNDVYTTFGPIKNLSSTDSKTLTFTFQPEYLREIIQTAPADTGYSVVVTVVNNNGISAQSGLFSLGK